MTRIFLSYYSGAATATVRAQSIFGAKHGLESLTQLVDVRLGTTPSGYAVPATIPATPVEIQDTPRFPFRGLMIECARYAK